MGDRRWEMGDGRMGDGRWEMGGGEVGGRRGVEGMGPNFQLFLVIFLI